jgi:hypothetical protein
MLFTNKPSDAHQCFIIESFFCLDYVSLVLTVNLGSEEENVYVMMSPLNLISHL